MIDNSKIFTLFVGIYSKQYTFKIDGKEFKKSKGVKSIVVNNKIKNNSKMTNFVWLCSKQYSSKVQNEIIKNAKGLTLSVVFF